jgi:hypothetical protein
LAKENLSKGGGDQKSGLAKLPKAITPIDTRKESVSAKLPKQKPIDTRKESANIRQNVG